MRSRKLRLFSWASLKGVLTLPLLLSVLFYSLNTQAQLADQKVKPGEMPEKAEGDYDLTDQARYESQVFVHEGLSVRTMNEKCAELEDPAACQGRGSTKFMGVDSEIVKMVARAYSIVGGMMGMQGDAFDFEAKAEGADTGTDTTGETGDTAETGDAAGEEGSGEKKKNYCTMIPSAGEMLAMFSQQTAQNTLNAQPVTQDTPQKELLYRAARSHDARAKSAKIQGVVWGATTACYAAYMAAGGIVINWKVIAQAGAAAFLTAFWMNEAKQQEKYSEEVKRIAEELPGKGDCNPHTQLNCYCAQKETMYDPVHCVPELHKRAIANDSFRIPCADKDMKPDANCDCISRDACFDQEFFSDLSTPGFVQFAKSSTGKDVGKLMRGELTSGGLRGASTTNNATRKLLGDLANKVDKNPSLNKGNKAISDGFEKMNIPRPIARLMASQPTTAQGRKMAAGLSADLNKSRKKFSVAKTSKGSNVLRFNRATGKVGPGKKKSGNNYNNLLNKFKKKKKSRSGNSVMKFAQKAEQQAQITKNKDRPLFEIISRRYQVSGWRRLEIQ